MNFRKIIGIVVWPIVVFGIFFPGRIMNSLLYYKNGSTLILDNYKINFPLSHWAYFEKVDSGYLITGRKVNGVVLEISVYEPQISIKNLLEKKCDKLIYNDIVFQEIRGNIYYCFNRVENFKSVYFQTEDNKLMLTTNTYDKNNSENMSEFNLLFNNIHPLNL